MLLSFLTGTHILPENRNIALRTFKNHKNEKLVNDWSRNKKISPRLIERETE